MIPFMIGFLISSIPVLYVFHLRVLSTSGSAALIAVSTLIFGFAGPYPFIGLALLFIPPGAAFTLRKADGPMLSSRSIISLTLIPLYFSALYFFMPTTTYLFYMSLGYSVAALDIWRRFAAMAWSENAYKVFNFKRTNADTPGSLSGFGALGSIGATALFLVYTFLLVPGNEYILFILVANASMYVFLVLFGVLKRSYIIQKMKLFQKSGPLHFDEPMLRFLAASFSVIVISSIVSLTL